MNAEPDPQTLHNRAAESAKETRQMLTAMATGSLAIFFLALTAKIEPSLDAAQKGSVVAALVSMSLAVFSGLWSAFADAQWSYCWAQERSGGKGENPASKWRKDREWWHGQKRWSEWATMIAFGIGVVASAVYVALRAL